MQHLRQPLRVEHRRADQLLLARANARDEQRGLARAHDLTDRVVAGHRHDGARADDQLRQVGAVLAQPDRQALGQRAQAVDLGRIHERPGHHHGLARQRLRADRLGDCGQQREAVVAGPGRHQHVAGRDVVGAVVGSRRPDVADVDDRNVEALPPHAGERVGRRAGPVDEDRVVVAADHLAHARAPLAADVLGAVVDVAQPEDELARPRARAQRLERRLELAAQAQRELVDDRDVGLEREGRGERDLRPHRTQLLDVEQQPRAVRPVGVAAADRELDRVGARRDREEGLDRGAGQDQRRDVRVRAGQAARDGQRAAQVAEPDHLVRVEEKSAGARGVARRPADRPVVVGGASAEAHLHRPLRDRAPISGMRS